MNLSIADMVKNSLSKAAPTEPTMTPEQLEAQRQESITKFIDEDLQRRAQRNAHKPTRRNKENKL